MTGNLTEWVSVLSNLPLLLGCSEVYNIGQTCDFSKNCITNDYDNVVLSISSNYYNSFIPQVNLNTIYLKQSFFSNYFFFSYG